MTSLAAQAAATVTEKVSIPVHALCHSPLTLLTLMSIHTNEGTHQVRGMLGGGSPKGRDPLAEAAAEEEADPPIPDPLALAAAEAELEEEVGAGMPKSVSSYVLGSSNSLDLVPFLSAGGARGGGWLSQVRF